MSEMKSAFEKALERADKLGKLSPEEMRERKEAEYTPIGRAIAERYLGHGQKRVFKEEMNRYNGDEKGIVIRAALSRLGEVIGLDNDELTERAMAGLAVLRKKERIGEANEKIQSLLGEYREAVKQKYEAEAQRIGREELELLHQLRISGSAVGDINLNASQAWQRISEELYSRFNQRLIGLKGELLSLSEEG